MTYPWYKKINPIWWIGNSNDPINGPEDHPQFHPTKPTWIRKILWGIRNPLHNFFFFVIGFEDQPEIVNPGNQWAKEGQKWNIVMPYIYYKGKKKEFYFGWRCGLRFGAAFRNIGSKAM
jgi:hypothetical protein